MAAPCRRIPLVVILGATGTGKSKLAIEIGKKFCGEIISTDSMQIYKGLDIVTNKVTAEEQNECPHHMIGYLSPLQYAHTVIDFRNKALPIIDSLITEGKVPIVVGGTNYYIEALLWNFLINKQDVEKAKQNASDESDEEEEKVAQPSECSQRFGTKREEDERFSKMETSELHKKLVELDSKSAQKIHPHNRRKIIRALEVFYDHGVTMSEVFEAQHEGTGGDKRGFLRYPDPCLIWIKTDPNVLDERLDKRVDGMMEQGLLKELQDFHNQYKSFSSENRRKLDFELGIFQTIGFKEFHQYLLLSEEEKQSDKGKQLLNESKENLKIATRQYARRQLRWITNRLLRVSGANVPVVYSVDSTDVSKWEENVHKPAVHIVESAIKGFTPDVPAEPYKDKPTTEYEHNVCHVCDGRVFITKFEWEAHIKSRKHRKRAAKRRKEEVKTQEISEKRCKNDEEVKENS